MNIRKARDLLARVDVHRAKVFGRCAKENSILRAIA